MAYDMQISQPVPPSFELLIDNEDSPKSIDVYDCIERVDSILDFMRNQSRKETPRWITEKRINAQHDYKDYLATKLRARYANLVSDFNVIFPDYVGGKGDEPLEDKLFTANEICHLLILARSTLEREELGKRDLFLANNYLDLVEECMIWLYSPELAESEIPTYKAQIDIIPNLKDKDAYKHKLDDLLSPLNKKGNKLDKDKYRPVFNEVISICSETTLDNMINNDLQIERLKYYKRFVVYILAPLLLVFPLITNVAVFKDWSLQSNTTSIYSTINFTGMHISQNLAIDIPFNNYLLSLLAAITFAVIGAVGGYISGLFETEDSETNLALYELSTLRSSLRIRFGAIAALLSFSFLSWNLFSGILSNSPGSFVLVAFLSGFSERYFIKLLKIEPENQKK